MDDLLNKPIDQVAMVVLDTETTGLFPAHGHRVVELGAVRYEPGPAGPWQIVAEFSQLLQPDRRMDPGATRVNGIRDADLLGMPRFADVAAQLLELLDGALLVAHNASFDAGFLAMELQRCQPSLALPNPWLCTMRLARALFYFGGNSLGHLARTLNVPTGRSHRALSDAYVTAGVLRRLVPELDRLGMLAVADLLEAQGGPIVATPPETAHLPSPYGLAMAQNRPLRITYAAPSGSTERVIEPLYATRRDGVSYLIAYCRLRQEQRTFRLDRIVSVDFEDTEW
jgi:DNA polymerase-3 subunit epsilon